MFPEEEEFKTSLPPLVAGPGHKVRIPPELMPDEETTLQYFEIFFTHVHPYVPVLDRANFYRQWQTDRESISPLILEAVFALAGRIADEPGEGQQWLALATSMLSDPIRDGRVTDDAQDMRIPSCTFPG